MIVSVETGVLDGESVSVGKSTLVGDGVIVLNTCVSVFWGPWVGVRVKASRAGEFVPSAHEDMTNIKPIQAIFLFIFS